MTRKYSKIKNESDHQQILGYREYSPVWRPWSKYALLSYLVSPIVAHLEGRPTTRFSNEGIALAWAQVLNQLGYEVEIIDWDDKTFKPDRKYDLVVAHGGKNFEYLRKVLGSGYKLIYFSTGTYWRFGNAAEDKRLTDLKRRRRVTLPHDRYVHDSEESANRSAGGIIIMGNQFTRSTYNKFPLVISLNNANFPDDHFDTVKKNYAEARNNWLFFAGAGNVHKGLDLVIEAFKDLNQNLYIITLPEKKFLSAYKNELKLPNIHFIGEVPMRTDRFYEIVDKCAFQIFPSCSEGQPGSVVEAMNQGLIPILSRESGLDADKYGVILRENTVDCIKETVRQMSAQEPSRVEAMAKKVRKIALKDHNPEKFRKDLKKAVSKILKSR